MMRSRSTQDDNQRLTTITKLELLLKCADTSNVSQGQSKQTGDGERGGEKREQGQGQGQGQEEEEEIAVELDRGEVEMAGRGEWSYECSRSSNLLSSARSGS
eukprot:284852-Hanusia_phi.AAC.2